MKSHCFAAPLFCLALLSSPWVHAATLEGQNFDDSLRLANADLQLNGLGLRGVMFIKGYVAGLYLHQKAATLQAIEAVPGPKRLQLRMLRKAGPAEFIDALVDGIRKNSSASELQLLDERIAQLTRAIQASGPAVVGDVINFDYVPDQGTTLTVNGSAKGPAIPGADFYSAVLRIFMGEHPVDKKLKQGMLGQ